MYQNDGKIKEGILMARRHKGAFFVLGLVTVMPCKRHGNFYETVN